MKNTDTSGIHRLLDDAFSGIAMTPEIQDLKEEIRGNLSARASELQAGGLDAGEAAERAVRELGDIDALIASFGGPEAVQGSRLSAPESIAETVQRNRVKPKPAFVVRTVILSFVLTTGITVLVLGALGVIPWTTPILLILSVTDIALPIGIIVADGLRQETSQHYPAPASRAIGFGISGAAMALGLVAAVLFLVARAPMPFLIAGIVLVAVSIVAFTWLGVTQTNRTKPWALAMQRRYMTGAADGGEAVDAFSADPAAAARFGIYTIVIWVLTFAVFGVLSATIGFAWSWIAIVIGVAAFFLTLARMLFPVKH